MARLRASRALPVLAVAAAVIAVVGLSLPRNTPGPVRSTIGSERAAASPDRAELLSAAEHQDALAEDVTAEQRAGSERFMAGLGAYPDDPTPEHVLAWLDQNCDEVEPATYVGQPPNLDCGLLAAPAVLNQGPPHVAADLFRALATLDVGSPTHADRCPNWASVDPAWRASVAEAEANLVWVKRNGTRLAVNRTLPEEREVASGGLDRLTPDQLAERDELVKELANRRFTTLVTAASPDSKVFVQCQPNPSGAHPERSVVGAMERYGREHGVQREAGEAEQRGLVPVDLAAWCRVETDGPDGGVDGEAGEVATTPVDPNAVPTTSWSGPVDGTTTSVGG